MALDFISKGGTLFCYIDESGSPGNSGTNDFFFGVAMVIFDTKANRDTSIERIRQLKAKSHKEPDFEFHLSKNILKDRDAFLNLIDSLNFIYVYISIKKDKQHNYGTYQELAERLIKIISVLDSDLNIRMDKNPALYSELKSRTKDIQRSIKIKQVNSKNEPLVQVADYIVSMSTKEMNGRKIPPIWKSINKRRLH